MNQPVARDERAPLLSQPESGNIDEERPVTADGAALTSNDRLVRAHIDGRFWITDRRVRRRCSRGQASAWCVAPCARYKVDWLSLIPGVFSATFLILHRMVGAGIFSVPSIILSSSGSVGASLLFWFLGAIFASAGTAVFIELGSTIPKSGGDKVYLDYLYDRPRYLAICVFAACALLTGWTSANAVVFGECTHCPYFTYHSPTS
jgi:hypothetical protein